MNLKYSSIFLFIATSLFGSSALASSNSDNTITFTGSITKASCDVSFDDKTGAKTVYLGNHSINNFINKGDKSTPVPFKISVNKNCLEPIENGDVVEYSSFYLGFNATTDLSNPKLLRVSGGATGVGVGVTLNGNEKSYIGFNEIASINNKLDENGVLNLKAFYEKSSDADVGAGIATATAIVTVNMK